MATLNELVSQRSPLIAPSIYDGISALLVHQLRFDAAYIGSYATGASKYGVPDIGYIGRSDLVDQVRRLNPIVDVPVIVDGEGGFGTPLHVARTVHELEHAGAAAIHIEDHEFGKHLGPAPSVVPLRRATERVRAASEARTSDDFWVIGRTDSLASLGLEAAVERCLGFVDAGADAVMVPALPLEDIRELKNHLSVPFVNVNSPGRGPREESAAGTDLLLYFGITHFAALEAMRSALTTLKTSEDLHDLERTLPYMEEFDEFLGIEGYRAGAIRHGLINPD